MSTATARQQPDAIVARVDRIRLLLAEARDATDAKKVADLARAPRFIEAAQEYAEEAIASATAVKIAAMTLLGEFRQAAPEQHGARGTGSNQYQRKEVELPTGTPPPTLAECGISKKEAMYAQALAVVKASNPELHQKIRTGKASVASAHVEAKRREKREDLKAKAAAVATLPPGAEVRHGDCLALLPQIPTGSVHLVFADPPYNIDLDCGEGHNDKLPEHIFIAWCADWMRECHRVLAPDGAMWVLINHENAAAFEFLLRGDVRFAFDADPGRQLAGAGTFHIRARVTWYESFGINNANNFNRCSRHLFYCVRDPKNFVFHHDAVSRPSDRQSKYNDARANPAGKLLDDVWFDIPRLVGALRLSGFPTSRRNSR